jgi:hypothetical protein
MSDQSVRRLIKQLTVLIFDLQKKSLQCVLLNSHAVKATDQKLHGVATK